MRLYKRKSSPKWWATWYDQDGRRRRKSTGTEDKELAQALAAKWQQESFMERHFGAMPEVPFRDALVRYGKQRQRENPRTYAASTRYRLQWLLDRFDGLDISEITLSVIQDFADERLEQVKEASVLKELSMLKAILNKAHREGRLIAVPPFPRIKQQKGRCRWMTVDEERRLLAAAASHLRPLIAFAVDTGGRRSELLKLDWRNVDLERGLITFTKTKNGEDRSVRLTERARGVLSDLGPQPSGPVFTYAGKAILDPKTSFATARRKAGIEDLRFHDLRHTFASRLAQQGVSLYEVMHLTGHKSMSMVQRYAHLAPDYQAGAIAALNAYGHDSGTVDFNESSTKPPNPLINWRARQDSNL
ncbi:MAG: site-specific integrase [Candidatus Glassbacteria bacterium]|nr:site-specific integrase [Candidatus Glassbacteria bacterium]